MAGKEVLLKRDNSFSKFIFYYDDATPINDENLILIGYALKTNQARFPSKTQPIIYRYLTCIDSKYFVVSEQDGIQILIQNEMPNKDMLEGFSIQQKDSDLQISKLDDRVASAPATRHGYGLPASTPFNFKLDPILPPPTFHLNQALVGYPAIKNLLDSIKSQFVNDNIKALQERRTSNVKLQNTLLSILAAQQLHQTLLPNNPSLNNFIETEVKPSVKLIIAETSQLNILINGFAELRTNVEALVIQTAADNRKNLERNKRDILQRIQLSILEYWAIFLKRPNGKSNHETTITLMELLFDFASNMHTFNHHILELKSELLIYNLTEIQNKITSLLASAAGNATDYNDIVPSAQPQPKPISELLNLLKQNLRLSTTENGCSKSFTLTANSKFHWNDSASKVIAIDPAPFESRLSVLNEQAKQLLDTTTFEANVTTIVKSEKEIVDTYEYIKGLTEQAKAVMEGVKQRFSSVQNQYNALAKEMATFETATSKLSVSMTNLVNFFKQLTGLFKVIRDSVNAFESNANKIIPAESKAQADNYLKAAQDSVTTFNTTVPLFDAKLNEVITEKILVQKNIQEQQTFFDSAEYKKDQQLEAEQQTALENNRMTAAKIFKAALLNDLPFFANHTTKYFGMGGQRLPAHNITVQKGIAEMVDEVEKISDDAWNENNATSVLVALKTAALSAKIRQQSCKYRFFKVRQTETQNFYDFIIEKVATVISAQTAGGIDLIGLKESLLQINPKLKLDKGDMNATATYSPAVLRR
jgi:hypothetical protein